MVYTKIRHGMSYRFTGLVILRVLMLFATLIVLVWLIDRPGFFFSRILLIIACVLQVFTLIRYVNKTNRELTRFLLALKHNDLSANFRQPAPNRSFHALQNSMQQVVDAYQDVRIGKEAQYQLLLMLINKVTVGMVLLRDQQIELINDSAMRMLRAAVHQSWSLILENNSGLAQTLNELGDSGRQLTEIPASAGPISVSIDVTPLVITGQHYKLITLKDINAEIEQKEIESWHTLIRILTHEIMNSITPIASLSETMQGMLTDKGSRKTPDQLSDEIIGDILFSSRTIQERSEGLLQFVEAYRRVTRVPRPKKEVVDVDSFLKTTSLLMTDTIRQHGAGLTIRNDKSIPSGFFDTSLMQQVLINLIANSIHAVESAPVKTITVNAFMADRQLVIEVTDTGKGIPPNLIRQVFVPFFSTRKEGSGIGLSLCRQIVYQHGGTLTLHSVEGEGTTCTIRLPLQKILA